jgi:hypothetical protein
VSDVSSAADRLLVKLQERARRRRRVTLDTIWSAFHEACPQQQGRVEARSELCHLLEELEQGARLRRPLSPRLYDELQRPALPRWVELTAGPEAADVRAEARLVPWHPALAFVNGLRSLARRELDALRVVQRFLAETPDAPVLTVRERSLVLFRDEKRLEALAGGRLFGPGRLSHALLRAREVHPPFVFRDLGAGSGDEALIVENKDTFASAADALRALGGAGRIRWVAFGAGNAILQSLPSLLEWEARPARVRYFGDIDTDGVEILWQLCAAHHRWPTLPPIAACEPLYARLVERATALGVELKGRPCTADRAKKLSGIFGPSLREAVAGVLLRGARWPQEAVTAADIAGLLG